MNSVKVGAKAFYHVAGCSYLYVITRVDSDKQIAAAQARELEDGTLRPIASPEIYTFRAKARVWVEKGKSNPHQSGYLAISG